VDTDENESERELWNRCLPGWAVGVFLAPFADEVGPLRANLAWMLRCALFALGIVSVLPEKLLDPVASGALVGAATVLLLGLVTD
jgi:hypothetical protein